MRPTTRLCLARCADPPPRPRTNLRPRRPSSPRGYSLVETLIALTLVTFSGLALMAVAWQLPRAMERSEAKALTLRALEGTLESLRSGLLPLAPGPIPAAPGTSGLRLRSGTPLSIAVHLELAPTPIAGLSDVTLRADYVLRGRATGTRLHSKIWTLEVTSP